MSYSYVSTFLLNLHVGQRKLTFPLFCSGVSGHKKERDNGDLGATGEERTRGTAEGKEASRAGGFFADLDKYRLRPDGQILEAPATPPCSKEAQSSSAPPPDTSGPTSIIVDIKTPIIVDIKEPDAPAPASEHSPQVGRVGNKKNHPKKPKKPT